MSEEFPDVKWGSALWNTCKVTWNAAVLSAEEFVEETEGYSLNIEKALEDDGSIPKRKIINFDSNGLTYAKSIHYEDMNE